MRKHLLLVAAAALMLFVSTIGVNAQTVSYLLNENFNSLTEGVPAGWDNTQGTTSTVSQRWNSSPNGYNSTRGLQFDSYYNSNGNTSVLTTPTLDMSQGAWILSFRYYDSTGGDLSVYLSRDGGATYQNLPIAANLAHGTAWQQFTQSITTAANASSTVKIVFVGTSNCGSGNAYIRLDDVQVYSAPTCKTVTGLVLSNLTATGATLAWGLGDDGAIPGSYRLTVTDQAGNTVISNNALVAALQTTQLTGLTAGTTYTLSLQSDCSDQYQGIGQTSTITFTTPCLPAQAPYTEDFDSLTDLPQCTFSGNASLTSTYKYGTSGRSLALQATTAEGAYIVFPELNLASNNAEVSFMAKTSSVSGGATEYMVGLVTDPSDVGSTFEPMAINSLTSTDWTEIRVNTSATQETVRQTAMLCVFISSGYIRSTYIDNVSIHTIPTCIRPENVTVTNITSSTAELSWQAATASQYRIGIIAADGTTTYQTATTNPYTVTGLEPNTYYSFTVRALCSAADSSEVNAYAPQIKTECVTRVNPVFFENFDNIVTGQNLPDCWKMGYIVNTQSGSSATQTPFSLVSSPVHSGSKAMQLRDMLSGTVSYLSTEPIQIDSAYKYNVRLWVNRQSSYSSKVGEGIGIFMAPNESDTVGAIRLGFVHNCYDKSPVEPQEGWYEYEYQIPQAGTYRLMVVGYSKYGRSTQFDDVEIRLAPTCQRVSDLSFNVGTTDARLSWTAGLNETEWRVDYTLTNPDNSTVTNSVVAATPEYTVQGLQPQSSYILSASVRAVCQPGDTAEAVSLSRTFKTLCQMGTVPYLENFENATAGSFADCWDNSASTSTSNNQASDVWGVYSYNNNKSLRMNNYWASSGDAMVNSPLIDLGRAPAELKFDYCNQATSGDLVVKVRRASEASFDSVLCRLSNNASNTDNEVPAGFTTVTYSLAAYQGDTVQFQFYNAANYDDGAIFIDNVIVRPQAACADIVGAPTIAPTDTSATITITDATVTAWQIAYGAAGADVSACTTVDVTTGLSHTITGLTASTGYTVYVRRVCGTEYGEWSLAQNFTTMAVPAQMPYLCDFENSTENASWTMANHNNGFVIGTATAGVYQGSQALYVSSDNGTSYGYSTGSSSLSYARRTLNLEAKGYQVEFRWKCTGGESGYDIARAFLVPAGTQLNTGAGVSSSSSITYPASTVMYFDPEGENCMVETAGDDAGWNLYSGYLDMNIAGAGLYDIVFMWHNDNSYGDQLPLAVDNIHIYELTCTPPSQVITTGVTATDLTLNFPQQTASEWEVVVDTAAFDADHMPQNAVYRSTVTTAVVTLNQLTPNTDYYYTVRTICGAGDTSSWRPVEMVSTFCSAEALPYIAGFETPNSAKCWQPLDNQGTIQQSSNYRHSGTGAMLVSSASAISPEFIADSLSYYSINGWAYSASSDSVSFGIGLMVDPSDATTYETFGNVMLSRRGTWTEFTAYFTALTDPDYADFVPARHIVLAAGNNDIYFDDIIVELTPTCPKPTEVTITNIADRTADIAFVESGTATQWSVRLNGSAQIINSNPATLTGLNPATTYSVEIASICGAGDTSRYTNAGLFRTECAPLALPYICGFETSDGFTPSSSYTSGAMEPGCWGALNIKPNGANYPYAYITSSTNYLHAGAGAVYCYDYNPAAPLVLLLPEFSDPTNNVRVGFWYKNGGSATTYHTFSVGYLTDPTNDSSFVNLTTFPVSGDWTYGETIIAEPAGMPANARLAIKYAGGAYGYAGYMDDLAVYPLLSCSDPEIPTLSNITSSSVDVAFGDTASAHTAWEYIYGPKGFDRASAVATPVDTSRTFTLTGLTDDTEYEVAVRAVCGQGDVSNWITVTFRTRCAPFVVSATAPFNDSFEDAVDNQPYRGCYSIDGVSGTYRVLGYVNKDYTSSQYIYAHSGQSCLQSSLNTSGTRNGHSLYRQLQLEAGKTYEAEIFARASSTKGTVSLLIGQNESYASMTLVGEGTVENCQSTSSTQSGVSIYTYAQCFERIGGYFTVPQTGVYNICVHLDCGAGTTYTTLYIDDLSVTELTGCLPVVPTVSNITTTTADVNLNDSTPGETFEYYVVCGIDTVVAPTTTTTSQFTLSGLSTARGYILGARRVCQDGNSVWNTVSFNTTCGLVTDFPYSESFEAVTFVPACWQQYSYGTYDNEWTRSTAKAHTGSASAFVDNRTSGAKTVLTTPQFSFTAAQGYRVKFWMYRTSYSSPETDEALHVYVSSTPIELESEANTATEIGVINNDYTLSPSEMTPGWACYTLNIPTSLVGNYYIGFAYHNQYGEPCYIDDITVELAPTCLDPQTRATIARMNMATADLVVPMNNQAEAQVGWVAATGNATADQITATASTSTGRVTATGLQATTRYAFFYRYICAQGDTSVWSAPVYGLTMASDCYEPQNLRTSGAVNDHHAMLVWGGAPDATGYEYQLTQNSVIVATGTVTVDTVVFDTLAASTEYLFRVRAHCSGDSTAWVSLTFSTTAATMSMPFICDFENPAQNQAWTMRDLITPNGNRFIIGSDASGVNGGSNALYVSNGSIYNYDNMVESSSSAEVLLEMEAGNYLVSYDWKSNGEQNYDYGRFFLLPAASSYFTPEPTGAIYLDNGEMSTQLSWQHTDKLITIAEDGVYRLVASWQNDDTYGTTQPLALDNISVTQVSCLPVSSIALTAINPTSATLTVTKNAFADDIEYGVATQPSADSVATWTPVNSNAVAEVITILNLTPGTNYYFFARHDCGAGNYSAASMFVFRTVATAVELPYVCGFEASEDLGSWTLPTSGSDNYFMIGSDQSNGGTNSMYITNDGATAGYDNGTTSDAYVTLPIALPAGQTSFSFDWMCQGESTYDYGRAFLAPTSMNFIQGIQYTGIDISYVPQGCIALDNSQKLNLSSTWQTTTATVTLPQAATYYLVFYWHNDGSAGTPPALCVDNISVSPLTCSSLMASNISIVADTVSAHISLTGIDAQNTVRYLLSSSAAFADTVAFGTTQPGDTAISLTGLQASSTYAIRFWQLCDGGNDVSQPYSTSFRTECGMARLPYSEGFESLSTSYSGPDMIETICWNQLNAASGSYSYPRYYASETINRQTEGARSLQMLSNSGTPLYLVLPQMENFSNAKMTFDVTFESATYSGVVYAGYVTNEDSVAETFVPITTTVRSTTFAPYTTLFSQVPAGARIAFKYGDAPSNNYYAWLDNIRVSRMADGQTYNDTICYSDSYTAHGFNIANSDIEVGDNIFTRTVTSAAGDDTLYTANVYRRAEIKSILRDTVCAGMPYNAHGWTIANPATQSYHQSFPGRSVTGCDSTAWLYLTVLPQQTQIYDTICARDSYHFGDTTLTTSGQYVRTYQSPYGCDITETLNLVVISDSVLTQVRICANDLPYHWNGQSYTASGTYTTQITSRQGCPQTAVLSLVVLPADSIVNITFCQGGQAQVADTFITTAGSFTLVRVNAEGCDITYHITSTVTPAKEGHYTDVACQEHVYDNFGFRGTITADTTLVINSRTADFCDSVTYVQITYHPTQTSEFTASLENGRYDWNDNTYTQPGDYTGTFVDQFGCDSVVTLHLLPGDGVDNVYDNGRMRIAPNPVHMGQAAVVFTENVGQVSRVEIINAFGAVIESREPNSTPIDLRAPQASGVYHVRIITADGRVYIEKLIVE